MQATLVTPSVSAAKKSLLAKNTLVRGRHQGMCYLRAKSVSNVKGGGGIITFVLVLPRQLDFY